jgi:Bacterial extracellular solute-binding protein
MYTWAIALLVGFAIAGAVLAVVGLIQAPPEPVEDPEVVKRVAGSYTGAGRSGGGCMRLTVASEASGATMAKLLRSWNEPTDGARPDVWSPSSSSWLKLLERRGTRSDLPGLVPAETPSMAVSPQVIAMPRPMAEALGWPDRKLGWRELLDSRFRPARLGGIRPSRVGAVQARQDQSQPARARSARWCC